MFYCSILYADEKLPGHKSPMILVVPDFAALDKKAGLLSLPFFQQLAAS